MNQGQSGAGDFSDEMAEYLQTFLDETEEQLDDLVETMLALEGDSTNHSHLNEAFRLIHSIKGSAGMMGLNQITVLTHQLENRFERFRSGTEQLDEPTMNLVLRCIDFLRQCNHRLRSSEPLGSPTELLGQLQELEHTHHPASEDAAVASTSDAEGTPDIDGKPDVDDEPSEAGESRAETSAGKEAEPSEPSTPASGDDNAAASAEVFEETTLRMIVQFRDGLPLADLKAQLIVSRLSGLASSLSTEPDLDTLAETDDLSGFEIRMETEQDHDRLRAAADVDGVQSIELIATGPTDSEPATLVSAPPSVEQATAPAEPSTASAEASTGTAEASTGSAKPSSASDESAISEESPRSTEADAISADARSAPTTDDVASSEDTKPAIEPTATQEPTSSDPPATPPEPVVDPTPQPDSTSNKIDSGATDADTAGQPDEPATRPEPSKPKRAGAARTTTKVAETMRVDIDRLDNLMNLAGELVVNRARFVQISSQISPAMRKASVFSRIRDYCDGLRSTIERLEGEGDQKAERFSLIQQLREGLELMDEHSQIWEKDRHYADEIGEAIDQLSRVSQGLQQGVLDTRMVPVGPLFNRFKRVVRDLSKGRGKQVDLRIRGEKTEMDKRMIDELGDPLMHLVRNSIDHGLESTAERAAAGKPEVGTVSLEASHSGNNVYIHIRDDGAGINVEKVRGKLIENHVMSREAAAELTDQQTLDYIWDPGFSTASEVTDVSGRGVGMDVVKTRIRDLNGTIDVESIQGQGTTFTIRLPLTLAIINCLLIRLRNVVFSMPIDDVREIVSVLPGDLVDVQGKQAFDIRGEFVRLVGIDEVFHWHDVDYGHRSEPVESNATTLEVVIVQAAGKTIGLRVDELLGSQDMVIKSLSDNFMSVRGLSGASILGDGSVCLMLDTNKLIEMATSRSTNATAEELTT